MSFKNTTLLYYFKNLTKNQDVNKNICEFSLKCVFSFLCLNHHLHFIRSFYGNLN